MDSKICQQCGESKPLKAFYRNRTKPDGFQNICKKCSDKQRTERHKRIVARRVKLATELRSTGCVICGVNDTEVIDFHHIDKKSEQGLSKIMYGAYSEDRFLWELAKCVPLCANDHRRVHAGRINLDRVPRYNIELLRARLRMIEREEDE